MGGSLIPSLRKVNEMSCCRLLSCRLSIRLRETRLRSPLTVSWLRAARLLSLLTVSRLRAARLRSPLTVSWLRVVPCHHYCQLIYATNTCIRVVCIIGK